MGHHHHNETGNIKVAFFLNFFFTIVEFIGGFYTNSLAIMSDAIHDLGDSISLGMSWYLQNLSNKKPNKIFSYGYKRFSLLGAIINSLILLIGAIYILIEAIPRLINPEVADAKGMMWFAILGIIVNGAAVIKLKKGTSINEKVVALHLMEDVLGWVAVLIASIVMQFWEIPILDPILSVLITLYILSNVYKNGKESIRIILQGTPLNVTSDAVIAKILTFDAVKEVLEPHLWSMDGEHHVFTAKLTFKNDEISVQKSIEIKEKIKEALDNNFHLEFVTLE